jgi:hypothetical protein
MIALPRSLAHLAACPFRCEHLAAAERSRLFSFLSLRQADPPRHPLFVNGLAFKGASRRDTVIWRNW